MYGELIPIYGHFAIHSFGVFLALGLIVFSYCFLNNSTRPSLIDSETFMNVLSISILSGLIGGRILHLIASGRLAFFITGKTPFTELFFIWQGGISLLGALLGILCTIPFILKIKGIEPIKFFDLTALYAPLLQAIARVGCFFSGCCYGAKTEIAWSTNHLTDSGQLIAVYPTQLYSASLLLMIFFIMTKVGQKKLYTAGFCTMLYLMLMSFERFFIDFFRGDREYFPSSLFSLLSIHQWISLVVFSSATVVLLRIQLAPHKPYRTIS